MSFITFIGTLERKFPAGRAAGAEAVPAGVIGRCKRR